MVCGTMTRRLILGSSAALISGLSAEARQTREFGAEGRVRGRMTVPVRIDGEGDFVFAVDTAANTSVIAADLVDQLTLLNAGEVVMNTLVGREIVQTVRCSSIQSGAMRRSDHKLAVASRLGLDGADGLIGVDLLRDFRVVLNFRGVARMRIARSGMVARAFLDPPTPTADLVVFGSRRFGELLMVQAWIEGHPVKAIIDTGARLSIVNTALARIVGAPAIATTLGADTQRVQSPTGAFVLARMAMLPNLAFAGVSFSRTPVLVGDFHTFKIWGLENEPAMLLGVDVLGMLGSVSIDLRRGELRLKAT